MLGETVTFSKTTGAVGESKKRRASKLQINENQVSKLSTDGCFQIICALMALTHSIPFEIGGHANLVGLTLLDIQTLLDSSIYFLGRPPKSRHAQKVPKFVLKVRKFPRQIQT